mgnify:FL=1
MKSIPIPAQTLPLDDSWDVIVCGGGPAGCTAAAAAAREGARTLLLETTGCLGGMGTSGLVPAWTPFGDGEKIIYRGLAQKVFETCKAQQPHVPKDALNWVPIDAELLKRVYDDLVVEFGAEVRFHHFMARAIAEDGAVRAVLTASKAGALAFSAKVYIDATGDGDLAASAGAPFEKGQGENRGLMPATHCFVLSNVDEYAYRHGPVLHPMNPQSPIYEILKSGKYPLIPDAHLCNNTVGPGSVGFNAGHLWEVDNTDPVSVSRAMMQGRKMAAAYRDALAEYHPKAFANAFLAATGSLMGIRETRRIVGDYQLTLDDYMLRRSFPDEICRNCYFIDIHGVKKDPKTRPEDYVRWEGRSHRYGKGESHGIPYRCLTPKGLRNVLVAGRCVSCDESVQGSVRVMPVCLAMGEAAGMAAAFAAAGDGDTHAVDVHRLRARLRECGAYLS